MRGSSSVLAALVAALALATPACKHTGPDGTLDAYGRALRDRRYDAAYDLMSAAFRAKVTREDYIRTMRDNKGEADDTAQRLLDARRNSIEVSAEFVYGLGDQMRLVQEHGGWHIATNPLAFYDQSTPQAALRSLLRAYKLQRWDVMMRFVPNAFKDKMTVDKLKAQFTGPSQANLEALMNALEANVDEPIQVHGNEATMRYGDHSEVRFLREDGDWKLKDLDG